MYPLSLSQSESVLSQLQEPHLYPELFALNCDIKKWRFYHNFRTDAESPIRVPQVGVRTHILSDDGHDLAASLQTIIEIGDHDALLSPRHATLLALNEPEMSLHPDLMEPLAELITLASRHSQVWVTTHSKALARMIGDVSGNEPISLIRTESGTKIEGLNSWEQFK